MNFDTRQIYNNIIVAIVCLATAIAAFPQSIPSFTPGGSSSHSDKKSEKTVRKPGNAWRVDKTLGTHYKSTIDTLPYNYQKQAIPSMVTDAYATTGNLGAEGQTQIFFERNPHSDFFFNDALKAWMPSIETTKFYNVYIPMTLLSYNFGGNKKSNQDRLRAIFAGNVNRRIGVGANLDYLYSKGSYESQAVKDFNFGFTTYYNGDRYQVQAFYNHYNMLNKENGGITNDLYILDPAELQGGVSKIDPKNIPTRLSAAHTKVWGQELYINQAFNLGFWKEEAVNDTLTREVYVPVTKFLWTFDYQNARHKFSNTNATQAQDFWQNFYLNAQETNDKTSYWKMQNTLGVQLIEGFQKWAKFGLSAYASYEIRKYTQMTDSVTMLSPLPDGLTPLPQGVIVDPKGTQNLLWVGGRITKQQGSILTYNADAKFGLIGDVIGDIDISGDIATRFKLFGDTVSIKANGHFRNTAQPYLIQHYISNNFAWDNDFGKTRSFKVGGELTIPWTRTIISAGFENIQNHVYFDKNGLPAQEKDNIQVFSATLLQRIKFGIWNWDNSITYQTSSKSEVIPIPTLAIYSNMYLFFKAFKDLYVQFGVDCNYYTRYYAPVYQPATMTFHIQDEMKIGNYPFMNVYLTCKLKKTRFFVMFSHVNQGWFSKEYFSMPHYPLNPRRLQFGISVDFAN
ncbi:MAG: hypothetical protein E7079_05415 [Bacteroidales bacterium]|nr:hypothetical protein [Bacteroidales bacterium]